MKKLAAFFSLIGVLIGTALIALLFRDPADLEKIGVHFFPFFHTFRDFLAAGAGLFLFTTMVASMSALFAPSPKPPSPDPETLAELKKAGEQIADLKAEAEIGEKQQLAFQAEAVRAREQVNELNGKIANLTNEISSFKEREAEFAASGDALQKIKDLTAEVDAFKAREVEMGQAGQAKRQIENPSDLVNHLSKENETLNETLKERNEALAESEKAQMEARDLSWKYPQLLKNFEDLKCRESVMANDLGRFKERSTELNSELVEMADCKKALIAERDELQRKLDELAREAFAAPNAPTKKAPDAAFQILFLLQKEGRLLDFLSEDLSEIDDAALGGAIRPIHESLKKILDDRLVVEPVLPNVEGDEVSLGETVDPDRIKLTGNVSPKGPYKGVLVHRGWKLKECKLPELVSGWTSDVIVPAEVEIS